MRVFLISVIDPTSRGDGGAAALRNAGLDVEIGVLDAETRLVIGRWLTALEQQRPFVTLVYAVHADGRLAGLRSVRNSLRGTAGDAHDLRLAHDAVLLDDGRLDEGIPDGHGHGVFHLAAHLLPEPGDMLASFAAGGVRSLLIDGDCPLAGSFLDAHRIDQAVAYIEISGSSTTGQIVADSHRFAGLISGFALRDLTRVGDAVRVSSRPPFLW